MWRSLSLLDSSALKECFNLKPACVHMCTQPPAIKDAHPLKGLAVPRKDTDVRRHIHRHTHLMYTQTCTSICKDTYRVGTASTNTHTQTTAQSHFHTWVQRSGNTFTYSAHREITALQYHSLTRERGRVGERERGGREKEQEREREREGERKSESEREMSASLVTFVWP